MTEQTRSYRGEKSCTLCNRSKIQNSYSLVYFKKLLYVSLNVLLLFVFFLVEHWIPPLCTTHQTYPHPHKASNLEETPLKLFQSEQLKEWVYCFFTYREFWGYSYRLVYTDLLTLNYLDLFSHFVYFFSESLPWNHRRFSFHHNLLVVHKVGWHSSLPLHPAPLLLHF